MYTNLFHTHGHIKLLYILLLFVAILFQASTSASSSNQLAQQAQRYDGSWSGTTSQGKAIAFTVINNVITTLSLTFILPECTVEQTLPINYLISDRFGHSSSTITSVTNIEGIFASSLSISGTASYTSIDPACQDSVHISWNATNTMPSTSTPTPTPTATSTASPIPTLTSTKQDSYLPIVLKPILPTATPTPPPTATLPSGEGRIWTINVTDAYQVAQLRCTQGIDSYTFTPKPGYALFIVNLEMHNSQSATVSSENIAVIDSNGIRWEVFASEFSGSYCPSTFVTSYPAGNFSDSFAFAVSESALGQPLKIVFADSAPAGFTVRR